jgi:acyl-CoA-binding protein
LADEGITKPDAEKKYVELVKSLKTKYGFKG